MQYLCYCPRDKIYGNLEEKNKRNIFFKNYQTTNHWPNILTMVPMQPVTYNYINSSNPILINYNELNDPI